MTALVLALAEIKALAVVAGPGFLTRSWEWLLVIGIMVVFVGTVVDAFHDAVPLKGLNLREARRNREARPLFALNLIGIVVIVLSLTTIIGTVFG